MIDRQTRITTMAVVMATLLSTNSEATDFSPDNAEEAADSADDILRAAIDYVNANDDPDAVSSGDSESTIEDAKELMRSALTAIRNSDVAVGEQELIKDMEEFLDNN